MSEVIDINKTDTPKTESNGKAEEHTPSDIELKILLTPAGEIKVYGPIIDEIFCYGLIEKAKDVIKMFNMNKRINEKKIIPAKGGILNFVRGKH